MSVLDLIKKVLRALRYAIRDLAMGTIRSCQKYTFGKSSAVHANLCTHLCISGAEEGTHGKGRRGSEKEKMK